MSLTEAAIRNSYLEKGAKRAEPDNLGAAIAKEDKDASHAYSAIWPPRTGSKH